jgi:hypothetical protein
MHLSSLQEEKKIEPALKVLSVAFNGNIAKN